MKFAKPKTDEIFLIATDAEWPSIGFETDMTGPHIWDWKIAWGAFNKSGTAKTNDNKWDAKTVITNYGGTLTVKASIDVVASAVLASAKAVAVTNTVANAVTLASPRLGVALQQTAAIAGVASMAKSSAASMAKSNAASVTASISIIIQGTNPSQIEVRAYLATKTNSAGFDKIIEHEARFKHFNHKNVPIKSFDNGYGMCQLTTPMPTFEQVWNWKLNVDGGLALFDGKRNAAMHYLLSDNHTFTSEQLKYEAVCRWNGGSYHEWDAKAGAWVRHPNILCDTQTGNIGWDMNDAENTGKTETALHNRDSASYSQGKTISSHWKYSGVCYADKILG